MIVNIKNVCEDFNSYRAARVKSLFNPERGNEFTLNVDIPVDGDDWGIGLIVGPSGSGKTSIGRAILPGVGITDLYAGWDSGSPIVDCIAPGGDFNDVTSALANVGLGDVPAWLRPFQALSNGRQFRAGLARALSGDDDAFIIDEFTSVVDRQIAKIGAMAFAKAVRRSGKKVILISCHYDIIEWLQPDWVFDTATKETKKKTISGDGLISSLSFGRSIVVTGQYLSRITI